MIWTGDPEIFSIGSISIRWYGLMFAMGFLISQQILFYVFRKDGRNEKDVEILTLVMIAATVVGARLGHVFFYEPAKYLANPIDILKIHEGGLASHGAAIGILIALYLYSRTRVDQSYLWVLDRLVIVIALTGGLIRVGNFTNSEIIGKPTEGKAGIVFARSVENRLQSLSGTIADVELYRGSLNAEVKGQKGDIPMVIDFTFTRNGIGEDKIESFVNNEVRYVLTRLQDVSKHVNHDESWEMVYDYQLRGGVVNLQVQTFGISRHPAQLYEAAACFILFILLIWYWREKGYQLIEGKIFSIFLVWIFGFRFLVEFIKENQVDFEDSLTLNMGQWLSIPLVVAGFVLWFMVKQKSKPSQI
ncbi:MAG: prolipoprotein diacylglyceryl transferase [Cyclobacteriaceae bacterium]|nr:prolipoprotein diacylglyceryl transferase [Cyclobacteriaceae bacterium]MCH8515766.1 prolipoprotein diacylglyceryl transferase [Cyclobacteriaceae bacterium]